MLDFRCLMFDLQPGLIGIGSPRLQGEGRVRVSFSP
jgi:hypothetical protein